ncbi:hypothetical protein SAMN05443543_10811 [Flavobacterium flevense]|uniref:Uncharacterized protein n=1 Tax=Flavobacterium flevense TaxID=983 RepID=A0A4Y4B3W5_9FLAO|nr:hypothetical protein [Flavobacterium flevense]GEC73614.1 hypothetical protein FFL01_31530 [Flavobacterium flevense]SHL97139.1 hypothetical protein SAMN05443543_10811 [Flavobacterium flevense]
MLGGTGDIRIIGGFVIWVFKGFKGSLKECINNYTSAFVVGLIMIFIIAFLCFNFYEDFKNLF